MTTDVYSKPGQPGEFLTRNGDNNDIGTCSGGYCPGATWTDNKGTCPLGYHTTYSGDSANDQHSAAGCSPTPDGSYSSSQTPCDAGRMCPIGSKTNTVNIPTGYYSASSSRYNINSLAICDAGKFCAEESTDANTDCTAGMYCVAGTVFEYDTPCSFGKTSSAGASSVNDCNACTSGEFCQQGSTAPLNDHSYCGNDNFLCIGGDLKRTTCTDGETTTDGAACSACPAGKFCTPGLAATFCSAGYESAGSLSSCGLSTPGQVTDDAGATQDCTDGKWTIAGQTNEFDCPAGFHCATGVKTECQNGEVCAQGESNMTPAAAGTVGDETGLFYDKPCPAGYTCPLSSARAEATPGTYAIQGTDGSTPTYCASGYSCDTKSIGPYQDACADGTWYENGVSGATATCDTCPTGAYCYQA
jgi:hypothetical protein